MAPLDDQKGIWKKKGTGKSRITPKGRQVDDYALTEIQALLGDRPRRKDLLIEFLHLIQDKFGHLSAVHIAALADEMRLAQTEVYEVATFYAHFDVVAEGESPPPALTIRVCDSLSCEMAGAAALQKALEDGLDPQEVRVLRAPCMGRCDTAPVLELGHHHIDHATPEKVNAAIASGHVHADMPDYEGLDTYQSKGGYAQLADLRANGQWEKVQEQVLESGLRGLGGAGFPSGKKWGFVRANEGTRYLAVNGDEGEPGTIKDRYYLERTPHLMLEGMLIAAWAVEAETCFIYMRDEYPAVLDILATEIAALETAGIVAPGYIDLRRGAGAYICGEETALLESLEGKRGKPRFKPPFPATHGLYQKPTVVNNVETLANIPHILNKGAEWFAAIGAPPKGTGTRIFCLSGHIKRPGNYEVPMGVTFREMIYEIGGGMRSDKPLKAFIPGGASAPFLTPEHLDVKMDFESLAMAGSMLGSGGITVMEEGTSMVWAALRLMEFFYHESCGKCTPCREGSSWLVQTLQRILRREGRMSDLDLLLDLCKSIEGRTVCAFGEAEVSPIVSTMRHWRSEYEELIREAETAYPVKQEIPVFSQN